MPRWLLWAASVVILAHLLAVGAHALAAQSGPWPTPFGISNAEPPKAAELADKHAAKPYLSALRMPQDYHFASNQPVFPGITFEVRLKDERGEVLKTLKFPDEKANGWVRHRQALLARNLGNDQPVAPRQGGVVLPAPGQELPKHLIWDPLDPNQPPRPGQMLKLVERDDNELISIQMKQPMGSVYRPSEWELLVARAIARRMCREHGAAKAQVIRHAQNPITPAALILPDPNMAYAPELLSDFGDFPR